MEVVFEPRYKSISLIVVFSHFRLSRRFSAVAILYGMFARRVNFTSKMTGFIE